CAAPPREADTIRVARQRPSLRTATSTVAFVGKSPPWRKITAIAPSRPAATLYGCGKLVFEFWTVRGADQDAAEAAGASRRESRRATSLTLGLTRGRAG